MFNSFFVNLFWFVSYDKIFARHGATEIVTLYHTDISHVGKNLAFSPIGR